MFWVIENIDALLVLTCLPVYVYLYFERTCKVLPVRSSHQRCSIKKGVLKISQIQACNFIKKETLAQMFSCEFSEIFKNTFFTEHLRTTASDKCHMIIRKFQIMCSRFVISNFLVIIVFLFR